MYEYLGVKRGREKKGMGEMKKEVKEKRRRNSGREEGEKRSKERGDRAHSGDV